MKRLFAILIVAMTVLGLSAQTKKTVVAYFSATGTTEAVAKQLAKEKKVFFSTDTSMSARDIMDIYRTRFQIEYLYRDAKQFTGLAHCQSRKKESLDFAFNITLSSINVARAFARSCEAHLSVSNVKTLIHNADMIQRFIRMSGMRPHRLLNTNDFKELLYYGVSDAA